MNPDNRDFQQARAYNEIKGMMGDSDSDSGDEEGFNRQIKPMLEGEYMEALSIQEINRA